LTTRYLSLRNAGFPVRRERNLLQKGLSVKSFFGEISALSQQVILQMAAGDTTVGSRPEKGAKLLRQKDQPEPFSCLIVTGTVMLTLFSTTIRSAKYIRDGDYHSIC
jgi:hypothetical protein